MLPWSIALLESLSPSLPADPCRLPTSSRFPGPFNGIPQVSPAWRGLPISPSGSALGFFEPLSGFLADLSFAALFRAATVPGIPPPELFPHEDRGALSSPPAPLQLSTDVRRRVVLRRSSLVSPTSTLSRGCLAPPATMDFFSTDQGPLPSRPGLCAASSSRSARFTYFEASSPREFATIVFGLPLGRWPLLSWCLPLRSFLLPRLGSSTRPAQG